MRYGDDRSYSNVHVQSFNLENASGAAGSNNFVSLHFLTVVPPYRFRHAHRHTFRPANQIPVVQESKNTYQSPRQPVPGVCTGHYDAARQYFHSNNSSDVILIIYYLSSKFSFRLFLLLSCIDLTFVLSSLCVPRITSQIRQKPSDNTNTHLLHNDLTSKTVENIGLILEGVKRPGREANHSYPVIHSVFGLTTDPKPPPKRFLHTVRSRATYFK